MALVVELIIRFVYFEKYYTYKNVLFDELLKYSMGSSEREVALILRKFKKLVKQWIAETAEKPTMLMQCIIESSGNDPIKTTDDVMDFVLTGTGPTAYALRIEIKRLS